MNDSNKFVALIRLYFNFAFMQNLARCAPVTPTILIYSNAFLDNQGSPNILKF